MPGAISSATIESLYIVFAGVILSGRLADEGP